MMRFGIFIIIFLTVFSVKAQYSFSGYIDDSNWQNEVYLSVIEDYRKISGVYTEQIIAKTNADTLGHFEFSGHLLDNTHKIYRIHVDNCIESIKDKNHFDGHCNDSKEVVFISKNKDSIAFPLSFEKQMFCNITSNNKKVTALVKIDSLKEDMRFSFSKFRSEANRKLNNKTWFLNLQNYGEQLNEPLAELYIYAFLSNRSSNLHTYYLEDLKTNPYYDNLLKRLRKSYPNSAYTKQYIQEITADKSMILTKERASFLNWSYLIYLALFISIGLNIFLFIALKKRIKKTNDNFRIQLTKQEQKILNLIVEQKTNKEIAETLFISLSTVKTHINSIYKKHNVQSRNEIKAMINN